MKLSAAKRLQWKLHNGYTRYKSKTMKKLKKKRDLSGKYVIVIKSKKSENAAIVKFINSRLCKIKAAVPINKSILLQTSSKYIITGCKKKSLLNNIEVTGSVSDLKRFKEQFENLVKKKKNETKAVEKKVVEEEKKAEQAKKITPIKIISCNVCNHKFTTKKYYDEHMKAHEAEESSGSESDLVIDEDVELILEGNKINTFAMPKTLLNLKKEPTYQKAVESFIVNKDPIEEDNLLIEIEPPVEEHHVCQLPNCKKSFTTRNGLLTHIGLSHKTEKPFKCNKCSESYQRESGLLAHQKINHPVTIIDPIQMRKRRQSVFVERPKAGLKTAAGKRRNSIDRPISFQQASLEATKLFVCSICSVTLALRNYLDRHFSVHHIKKMYLCYKCNAPYDVNNLFRHLKEVHGAEKGQTQDENFIRIFKDINSVAVHRCPFCIYCSNLRTQVEEHMKNEHYDDYEKNSNSEKDEMVSSPDSLENFMTPEAAQKSARKPKNDSSFKFRCARCFNRYSTSSRLRDHTCSNKSIQPTLTPPTKFQPIAPKLPMRITQKTQLCNGFFRCLSCPQVFTDRIMYNNHMMDEHRSSPVEELYSNLL